MDYTLQQTHVFARWHASLHDLRARIAIARRLEPAAAGNLGDVKALGGELCEMRVAIGAGYRIYFIRRGTWLIILRHGATRPPRQPISIRPGPWQRSFDMAGTLVPFDMATLLDNDEAISEYLSQVLADGDTDELLRALGHVARARGMAQVSRDSGLGRASLYKTFAPGAKPRFDTVVKVMRALGIQLRTHVTHG